MRRWKRPYAPPSPNWKHWEPKSVEISLPHTELRPARLLPHRPRPKPAPTWPATTASALARASTGSDMIDSVKKTRALFGPEVKRRIMLGTYALSAGYYDEYYGRALKVRTLLKQDFLNAFEQVDVIATPTSPTTAFKIGENVDDPLAMYLQDIFTLSVNLSASCGLSVPCGFDSKGSAHRPATHRQRPARSNHSKRSFCLRTSCCRIELERNNEKKLDWMPDWSKSGRLMELS